MKNQSCSNCRFSTAGYQGTNPGDLTCRRLPPHPHVTGPGAPAEPVGLWPNAEWPDVMPDEWCGEWQEAAPVERRGPTGERVLRLVPESYERDDIASTLTVEESAYSPAVVFVGIAGREHGSHGLHLSRSEARHVAEHILALAGEA